MRLAKAVAGPPGMPQRSLAEALAKGCLLQRYLGQGMLQKTSLADVLGPRNALQARNAFKMPWQKHLDQEMLQDVSARGTWSKNCFNMSVPESLRARNVQDVSDRGAWSKECFKMSLSEALGARNFKMSPGEAPRARNASRCLCQRQLEQEMLQDVSGRGSWSKKCFKMALTEALGARIASRCLCQRVFEQEPFKMSLTEALGARNASRCLWQRHLEQGMLEDVSARGTWSKKCFKMSSSGKKCFPDVSSKDVSSRGTWSKKCFKMSLAEPWQSKKCFKMSVATGSK